MRTPYVCRARVVESRDVETMVAKERGKGGREGERERERERERTGVQERECIDDKG